MLEDVLNQAWKLGILEQVLDAASKIPLTSAQTYDQNVLQAYNHVINSILLAD